MVDIKANNLQLQTMQQRLQESEDMLSRATKIADDAYLSLSAGDVEACQHMIGELIHSISEHFYEELH